MRLSHGEQVAFNEDFKRIFDAEHRAEARDVAISDEITELLKEGGKCDPLTFANFSEAIENISDEKKKIILAYFATAHEAKGNNDLANHGLYVAMRFMVQEYWCHAAEKIAERNVDARLS